tara:strand:- start:31172 stop:31378 length:207 start_codon:yes stop_codon:yes gene_type:complete
MLLDVFVDKENKNLKVELEENSVVSSLLEKMEINPVTVIVAKNGEVVTRGEILKSGDEVKILSVLSGG